MNTTTPTVIIPATQKKFRVLKTTPANLENNVYPGEIKITITTDEYVISPKSFSLSITPSLPDHWEFSNSFPSKTLVVQVYGGLALNTEYSLALNDADGNAIYNWKFTTSSQTPENSTGAAREETEKLFNTYYPLIYDTPYSTGTFKIEYYDRLTFEVTVYGRDVEKIKQEVNDWVKSKGVDPSTHTFRYIVDNK